MAKNQLDFIIAGTGRSGSRFIKLALTMLGLPCGHERVFSVHGVDWARAEGFRGDSTWHVIPYLGMLPRQTQILHQVRDPLDTINSLTGTNYLRPGDPSPYSRAKRRIWPWLPADPVPAAMEVWLVWNRTIEDYATTRWKVEEVDARLLRELLQHFGVDVELNSVLGVLKTLGAETNKHKRNTLTWGDLPQGHRLEAVKSMARRYGYPGSDEERGFACSEEAPRQPVYP